MSILLDTHILIWALTEPEKLSGQVHRDLSDPDEEVLFSAISILEIAIKSQILRDDFTLSADGILAEALASGFVELPVGSVAAARVATLPLHHRDPFDRLLVAQAMTAPAHLYTVDRRLRAYSELVRVV